MNRLLLSPDSEYHRGPEPPATEVLEIESKTNTSLGEQLTHQFRLALLVGALGVNMAIGGHMKAARHALAQSGKLNNKEKMPADQKKLRRRKRKKK